MTAVHMSNRYRLLPIFEQGDGSHDSDIPWETSALSFESDNRVVEFKTLFQKLKGPLFWALADHGHAYEPRPAHPFNKDWREASKLSKP
ncbi:unnamed protein product [Cylindrotheca closterium]|uniref:Uncharacterized protein n=1 Tax=Cylindrotheca closterium TaxID=2856 RepID=A0AAD2PY60_9STRA|nr:unnamed protein product [Cylindrotheca closterium]CAJ1959599.1 unnamed protein product [Cylindrotheca closterium]CAJ1970149.1 unnamed protein product [Cylindrotheca closterium]CAJ1970151.1 unnamed protein product [Cylindrotheca closterium]